MELHDEIEDLEQGITKYMTITEEKKKMQSNTRKNR